MQVLTPSGYRSPAILANGDEVCAFDTTTGSPIVNHIENIDFVDYSEWCRWWSVEDEVPPFIWYRINGSLLLFREQSIWRNGAKVCHARDLVAGDEIYDDADHPVTISTIEEIEDQSLIWYRFDISGDHSYIVDGLTVHNASRFWVSGTGTWDSSSTTHWGSSSGTADNASVPGSADSPTFDGNSGGGTVTLNFGGTITVQSLGMGSYTGTFENSVNNNNITCSAGTNPFNLSGSATRTYKLGSATYTMTATTASWQMATTTNLTFLPGTSTIAFTGGSGSKTFNGGDKTYGTLSLGAMSGNGLLALRGSNTFASLSITAPCCIELQSGGATTLSGAVSIAGSSSAQIAFLPDSTGSGVTLALAGGSTFQWCGFRGVTFTGSPTISNSFDLGNNSGATITAPSTGGGSVGVIGS